MATIEKQLRKKDGKYSYYIQIKVKDPITMKVKYYCTTWKNPDNLTGKRLDNALKKFVYQWEEQIKSTKNLELQDFTFTEMANRWLAVKKNSVSESYHHNTCAIVKRLCEFFGNIKFADISPVLVENFFLGLNQYEFETTKALLKPEKASEFDKLVLSKGVRKVSAEGYFSRPTLYNARKEQTIEWDSAVAICKRFNLKIEDYFFKLKQAKKYMKETKLKYQRTLSAIFNYAIKNEIVSKNYASSTYLKGIIGGDKKEYELLTNDELARLYDTLKKYDTFDTIPIYLMTCLGLRTCEVCGLEWKDIDFEQRIISINRNRVYVPHEGIIRKELKTIYSHRDLYLCDSLYKCLSLHKQKWDKLRQGDKNFNDSDAIFCHIDGSPCFPSRANNLLKKYLIEADCKHVTNHKLRHGWITELISNQIPANIVAKMAGHVNAETTLKIYTHYSKDADNSKDILNKLFANIA